MTVCTPRCCCFLPLPSILAPADTEAKAAVFVLAFYFIFFFFLSSFMVILLLNQYVTRLCMSVIHGLARTQPPQGNRFDYGLLDLNN